MLPSLPRSFLMESRFAIKSVPGDGKKSAADRELAIQQIVSRAVVSTEIVDIMKAAGLASYEP
jgi:type I restriction enzyme R subunit